MAIVAIAIVALAISRGRARNAQQKRDAAYQKAVDSYSEVLKPGMTRKQVEDYLHAKNIPFRQMCCVDYRSLKRVWDDLAKIGQEDPPWFCSEKNVYVAFQFVGSRTQHEVPNAQPSDELSAITLYPWLEGCL